MRNLSVLIQGLLSLIFVGIFPLLADELAIDYEKMRIGDSSLEEGQLKLMLNPMPRDELDEISHAWRNSLKETVQKISDLSLEEKKSPELIEVKVKQLALLRTVLAELKKKGGDPSDLKIYADAVSGTEFTVNENRSFWTRYSSWIYSKEGGVKWGIQLLKFAVI